MRLDHLDIRGLRSLREVSGLSFHPRYNLITGANAAGKTTLLEAIDLLSRTRSFRTRNPRELIAHGEPEYLLSGEIASAGEDGEEHVRIGQRRDAASLELRMGGEPVRNLAQLASRIAVQVIHQGSHEIVCGAPARRRAWLDWGVFHVEQGYPEAWSTYQKALRQRNAALRARQDPAPWDQPLAQAGQEVDECRRRYLETVRDCIERFSEILLPGKEIGLSYQGGFDESRGLLEALRANTEASRDAGHTMVGPHRADVSLRMEDRLAASVVSGGQAKLLSCCLLLSQVMMFQEMRGESCILLFDELASDLDREHQEQLIEALGLCETQLFLTRIGPPGEDLPDPSAGRMFHVEQGLVQTAP